VINPTKATAAQSAAATSPGLLSSTPAPTPTPASKDPHAGTYPQTLLDAYRPVSPTQADAYTLNSTHRAAGGDAIPTWKGTKRAADRNESPAPRPTNRTRPLHTCEDLVASIKSESTAISVHLLKHVLGDAIGSTNKGPLTIGRTGVPAPVLTRTRGTNNHRHAIDHSHLMSHASSSGPEQATTRAHGMPQAPLGGAIHGGATHDLEAERGYGHPPVLPVVARHVLDGQGGAMDWQTMAARTNSVSDFLCLRPFSCGHNCTCPEKDHWKRRHRLVHHLPSICFSFGALCVTTKLFQSYQITTKRVAFQ
jgi:hypothetical protein